MQTHKRQTHHSVFLFAKPFQVQLSVSSFQSLTALALLIALYALASLAAGLPQQFLNFSALTTHLFALAVACSLCMLALNVSVQLLSLHWFALAALTLLPQQFLGFSALAALCNRLYLLCILATSPSIKIKQIVFVLIMCIHTRVVSYCSLSFFIPQNICNLLYFSVASWVHRPLPGELQSYLSWPYGPSNPSIGFGLS